jgi:hypothetical protein
MASSEMQQRSQAPTTQAPRFRWRTIPVGIIGALGLIIACGGFVMAFVIGYAMVTGRQLYTPGPDVSFESVIATIWAIVSGAWPDVFGMAVVERSLVVGDGHGGDVYGRHRTCDSFGSDSGLSMGGRRIACECMKKFRSDPKAHTWCVERNGGKLEIYTAK